MDIREQLEDVKTGKLSRRAFNNSLMAAGIGIFTTPFMPQRAAAAGDQATFFTWGGYDIPELFEPYEAKHGALPNFSIFGGSEEALDQDARWICRRRGASL